MGILADRDNTMELNFIPRDIFGDISKDGVGGNHLQFIR